MTEHRRHKRRKVHQFTHYGLGYPLAYQGSYWHVGDGPCHDTSDAPSAGTGGDAGAGAGDGGMAAAASAHWATVSEDEAWDAGPQPLQPEDVEDEPTAVHNGHEFYQLPPMEHSEPRKATEEDIQDFCKKWGIDPSVLTPEAIEGIMHNRNTEYEREFRKNKARPVFDMTRTPIIHDSDKRFWVGQPGDFHENIMSHFPDSAYYHKGYYKNAPDDYSKQGEHGMFYNYISPEALTALRQHMLTQPSFAGWTDEQIKAKGPGADEPSSEVFSHTAAWEDLGLLHYNDFGKPCKCTFYQHEPWHHTAGKLHDFLMNPKSRPDLQTPEAQEFLHTLSVFHNDKIDGLMPWLTREWKKGRVGHDIRQDITDPADYGHLTWKDPATATEMNPEGRRRTLAPEFLDHWADFLRSSHPLKREMGDIMQHHVGDFSQRVQAWDQDMKDRAKAEALAGGEVVHTTPDGWTIRNLTTPEELKAEGDTMGHCVGGYHQDVERGNSIIHSLRDPKGIPHATIEISPRQYEEPHPDAWLDHAFEHDPVARHLPPDAQEAVRSYDEYRRDPEAWKAQHGPLDEDIRVGWQGFYNQLHDKYKGWGRKAVPHGGEVVQIQGKGNETPKPEYQERIKHYFLNHYSDDERPKSGDPGYYDRNGYWVDELRHPDHIPEAGAQDDPYGLNAKPMDADWDDLMDNISFNSHGYYDTHNGDHVHDIYELAKHRGEIPQLAKAAEGYGQKQQESFDQWLDMNYDHAPRYPDPDDPHGYQDPDGEEADEGEGAPYWEPNGPDGERHFNHNEAEKEYESAMESWTDQHPGTQATNHMYSLLKPHWNPESSEYANELYNPEDEGKQREVFGTWTQLDARPNDPLMVHNQQDPLPSQEWLDHNDYSPKDHEHVWGANAECQICGVGYSEWNGPAHSDTHQTVAPHPEDPVKDLRNMSHTTSRVLYHQVGDPAVIPKILKEGLIPGEAGAVFLATRPEGAAIAVNVEGLPIQDDHFTQRSREDHAADPWFFHDGAIGPERLQRIATYDWFEDPTGEREAGAATNLMEMMGLDGVVSQPSPISSEPPTIQSEPPQNLFDTLHGPTSSSQIAAQHTGSIPGDELWAQEPVIDRKNPRAGVNPSFIGSVNGSPAYIKPEGRFHSDDLAKERAAFHVARTMGIDMPHTVVHPVNIPEISNMYRTTPAQANKLSQIQQGIEGHDMIDTHTPDTAVREFPEDTRRIGLFDHVIANQDRHMGNVLLGEDGRVRPIDHGGAFQPTYFPSGFGLRYNDEPLTPEEMEALNNALKCDTVACGISPELHQAMVERIQRMLASGRMYSQ